MFSDSTVLSPEMITSTRAADTTVHAPLPNLLAQNSFYSSISKRPGNGARRDFRKCAKYWSTFVERRVKCD